MSQFLRVSKKFPCVICNHTDWCMIGRSVVVCMRVTSSRPTTAKDGSTGYLHPLSADAPARHFPRHEKANALVLDAGKKMAEWTRNLCHVLITPLADSLGVSVRALDYLDVTAAPYWKTWAFPMRNGNNAIVGIRLRNEQGHKWAERGSHQGLFLPQCEPQPTVYLVEGPTDTAAALTLGVFAIGRPSCNGGIFDLQAAIKRLKIRRAVIVADTDSDKLRDDGTHYNPGVDGAMGLSEHLGIPNCTLLLPCKDIRQFLKQGGDRATLEYLVSQCVWRNPQ